MPVFAFINVLVHQSKNLNYLNIFDVPVPVHNSNKFYFLQHYNAPTSVQINEKLNRTCTIMIHNDRVGSINDYSSLKKNNKKKNLNNFNSNITESSYNLTW